MNRVQRRAAQKPLDTGNQAATHHASAEVFERAIACENRGEWPAASNLYRKMLSADPDHARACDRLAQLYLAQGKRDKASAQFAELVRIAPQTLNRFDLVLDTLKKLQPVFAAGLAAYSRDPSQDDAGTAH